jgi:hypothetical protein
LAGQLQLTSYRRGGGSGIGKKYHFGFLSNNTTHLLQVLHLVVNGPIKYHICRINAERIYAKFSLYREHYARLTVEKRKKSKFIYPKPVLKDVIYELIYVFDNNFKSAKFQKTVQSCFIKVGCISNNGISGAGCTFNSFHNHDEADRSFGTAIYYQPLPIEPNEDEQLNPCETVYIKSQEDLCEEKFLDVAIDDGIHDQNRTEEDDQEVDEDDDQKDDEEGDDTESEDSDSDDTSVDDDFENVEETHWQGYIRVSGRGRTIHQYIPGDILICCDCADCIGNSYFPRAACGKCYARGCTRFCNRVHGFYCEEHMT